MQKQIEGSSESFETRSKNRTSHPQGANPEINLHSQPRTLSPLLTREHRLHRTPRTGKTTLQWEGNWWELTATRTRRVTNCQEIQINVQGHTEPKNKTKQNKTERSQDDLKMGVTLQPPNSAGGVTLILAQTGRREWHGRAFHTKLTSQFWVQSLKVYLLSRYVLYSQVKGGHRGVFLLLSICKFAQLVLVGRMDQQLPSLLHGGLETSSLNDFCICIHKDIGLYFSFPSFSLLHCHWLPLVSE